MLLTISTIHQPATDLGFLLHKHPERCQTFSLTFGKAHVFYPEANDERCVACLLLDIDPVGLVRGKGNWKDGLLDQYVNDRPFVASSLMSVAISQVFGSALSGKSKERTELVDQEIPLTARIDVLPVRGGEEMLERMFGPLGYTITAKQHPLDEKFPEWGESPYYSVELQQSTTVSKLLQHLYVLIPVFDGKKHYYIGPDEVEKLLSKGDSWLRDHPEKATITRRYLSKRQSLVRQALARLVEEEANERDDEEPLTGRCSDTTSRTRVEPSRATPWGGTGCDSFLGSQTSRRPRMRRRESCFVNSSVTNSSPRFLAWTCRSGRWR